MKGIKKLGDAFYHRADVVQVAREMLGKLLVTNFDGEQTSGRIVETEAYAGAVDKASHAYGNRRTARTEIMYSAGGRAYVYLCYGIHHLFNVVTNAQDVPHAILIRAVEPVSGIEVMLRRVRKSQPDFTITRGPGNVSKALGLFTHHTGADLSGSQVYIADDGYKLKPADIIAGPRIGVDYAAEDAFLPYRFVIKGNKYLSGPPKYNR